MAEAPRKLNFLENLVTGGRPKTLPAAAAPSSWATRWRTGMGYSDLARRWQLCWGSIAAANGPTSAANVDVFDFHRGADATGRLGPIPRVTQAGLLTHAR